jgi:ClpP class serine protease
MVSRKNKVLYLIDKRSKFLSNNNDYKNLYLSLAKIESEKDVDIIIQTNGGELLWTTKICYLIKNRKGKTRIFVKNYAHSAGTLIALAGSELYLTFDSTLSPIDPQTSIFKDILVGPMKEFSKIITAKKIKNEVGDIFKQRTNYCKEKIKNYINDKLHNTETIIEKMFDEPSTHEVLFFKEELSDFGINYNLWNGKDLPK